MNTDNSKPGAVNLAPSGSKTLDETWCDPDCPHLQLPTDCSKLDGRCKSLNVELDYYDFFLAACKYENVAAMPNDES
jgi:hypothetical protein